MTVLEKERKKLNDDISELSEMREDMFNVKADITVSALGLLLKKLDNTFSDYIAIVSTDDKKYNTELCDTLKTTIGEAIMALSQIKTPDVKVNPNINIDFKPLQQISGDINKGQNTLIALVQNFIAGDRSEELYKLILSVISKQNTFLEKGLNEIDYTKTFEKISDGVNNRVEKLLVVREEMGHRLIKELIPVYKDNTNNKK